MTITAEQAAKLLEGTTPGPWSWACESGEWLGEWLEGATDTVIEWDFDCGFMFGNKGDRDLIASAPDLAPADALAELQRLRVAVAQSDHVVAEWAEVSQTNYQRAKAAEAERDAALAQMKNLRHQITEASDPDFIFGAMDNVHDWDPTLADYAAAVSRAIRAALGEDARHA